MKYFFTLCFTYLLLAASAQKLTYDIFLFGSKIGQTTIERTLKEDSFTRYVLNSASEAHVLFSTRKVTLYYDILYKAGDFFSSYSIHTRNDETHYTNIMLSGNGYNIKRDKDSFRFNELVNCSTVKLFFEEPCSLTKVLSERLGEYRTLIRKSDGTYEAEMSDGITYIYRYKNGKLQELEMRKSIIGSVYLRLRE